MSFRPMTDEELLSLYATMKFWMTKADEADRKFNARKKWWEQVFETNPFNYRQPLQRRDALDKDWMLKDQTEAYKHAQAEVLRYHALIDAERTMRAMLFGSARVSEFH